MATTRAATAPSAQTTHRVVGVRMRDGVVLATDVVLPAAGPHPVLLIRTPYDRRTLDRSAAEEGWAVVAQDCRGRGESEGEFRPFHAEARDGADTIEWCRRQPWCDGRVVLAGVSYEATTALLTAGRAPAGLGGLAPELATDDVRDGWMYEGGAFLQLGAQGWAYGLAMGASQLTAVEKADLGESLGTFDELLSRPVADCGVDEATPAYRSWVDRDADYWSPLRFDAEAVDVPGFHVAGWFDPFCEGSLRAYRALVERGRAPQRLVVGPWVHMDRHGTAAGSVDFGPEGTGANVPREMRAWLAGAMAGEPVTTGARCFDTGLWRWCELAAWPPSSRSHGRTLPTATQGLRPVRGDAVLRHDPASPVPTLGGRAMGWPASVGVQDQALVEARGDVLVLTSEPLEGDLCVAGEVHLSVVASATGPSADLVAYLCDVDASGRSTNVVGAARRSAFRRNTPTTVRVELGSCLHTFRAGHRLRVRLSISDFPRVSLNPSRAQDVTIFLGEHAPELHLPTTTIGQEGTR